jgi:hypothetical protein
VKNYCPKCRETTGLHEKGVCLWCDGELVDADQAHALTANHLRVLRLLRQRGYTIKAIAEANHRAWGYASANTCQHAISVAWKHMGLRKGNHASLSKDTATVVVLANEDRSQPERTGK